MQIRVPTQWVMAVPNSSDEFSIDLAGSPRSHVGTPTRVVPPRAPRI